MALTTAFDRGLQVDLPNLKQQVERTQTHLDRGAADYRQGKGQGGGVDTSGYALLGLWLAEVPQNETTSAVVHYLLQIHRDKKHWACTGDRPPTQTSDLSTTAVAMLGLEHYFDASPSELTPNPMNQFIKRISDCDEWLATQKPVDTEQRVFRLIIAKSRERIGQKFHIVNATLQLQELQDSLKRELLATQNADGGWAQLPDKPESKSDAYATATALHGLTLCGLKADDPVYLRGLGYLLETQQADGSWHVATRSKPIQKYFESGFPHGVDQFISMQATCWSITALCQALPTVARPSGTNAKGEPSRLAIALQHAGDKKIADTVKAGEKVGEVGSTPSALGWKAKQLWSNWISSNARFDHCWLRTVLSCHGPDDQSGELRVDSLESLLKAANRVRPSYLAPPNEVCLSKP